MAMQMQALVASPIGTLACGSGMTRMSFPSRFNTRSENKTGLQVKCMAKKGGEGQPDFGLPSSNKASTTFTDLFAFSGPAPERINGRLAMIGFVAAVAVELSKGSDLSAQLSNGGVVWFLGTSILLSVASLVPLFKGERAETKTEGLMNSNAELWNGRFAMVGLIALALTEYLKGGALV